MLSGHTTKSGTWRFPNMKTKRSTSLVVERARQMNILYARWCRMAMWAAERGLRLKPIFDTPRRERDCHECREDTTWYKTSRNALTSNRTLPAERLSTRPSPSERERRGSAGKQETSGKQAQSAPPRPSGGGVAGRELPPDGSETPYFHRDTAFQGCPAEVPPEPRPFRFQTGRGCQGTGQAVCDAQRQRLRGR